MSWPSNAGAFRRLFARFSDLGRRRLPCTRRNTTRMTGLRMGEIMFQIAGLCIAKRGSNVYLRRMGREQPSRSFLSLSGAKQSLFRLRGRCSNGTKQHRTDL